MFEKAPEDVLDFTWDWTTWMPSGDAISTVDWVIPETFLPPPVGLIDSPSTIGGSFAANSYYWVVTAVNFAGETTPSNEVTATLTGTTSSVGLGWNPVPGATGYNLYRGSNSSGTPVTLDSSATGTKIGNATGTTTTLTATCTYTRGSSANYVVASVGFFAGLTPSLMTCSYGTQTMTLLGWNVTAYGGIAYFGLSSPATGSQTVSATVQSYGNVFGVVVACSSYVGWGSTQYTGTAGGQEGSPSQTVSAVYGDMVVWSAVNVTGSAINAAMSSLTGGMSLENSGNISLALSDQLALLVGYTAGPSSGGSTVSFAASVAAANIDQWWSAAALTLLPAAPPINTLVTSINNPSTTQYTDTGSTGTAATPPAANTAVTSISQAASNPLNGHTTTTATVVIADGTAGGSYPVTCQISTAAGRVAQNTQTVNVLNL